MTPTQEAESKPMPFGSRRALSFLLLALTCGILFGWRYGRTLGSGFEVALPLCFAAAATVQGTEIIRVRRDAQLWFAALPVLLSLWIASSRAPQVPLLSLLALLLWAGLLVACLTHKRRLALWCVWLSGASIIASKVVAVLLHP